MSRSNIKYIKWVNKVLKRDKVCVVCGTEEELEAHHLYSYKHYPKKRLSVRNGVTLCKSCHTMFHTSYLSSYRVVATRKLFKNFLELLEKIKNKKLCN